MNIIDTISADSIEIGDQIIIDGDPIEVKSVIPTEDLDEVVVMGYSYESGDTERYSLYADDYYDLWSV